MNTGIVAIIIICMFILIYALLGIRIVRPHERGIVERLGSFNREVGPGLNIIKPFFESMRKLDLREQVSDVPPQEVITKDNVVVTVDAVMEVGPEYQVVEAWITRDKNWVTTSITCHVVSGSAILWRPRPPLPVRLLESINGQKEDLYPKNQKD